MVKTNYENNTTGFDGHGDWWASLHLSPPINSFWFIREGPTCRKEYSCNHCMQYFYCTTQCSNIQKIVFLQSHTIAYNNLKENSFSCITKYPSIKKILLLQSLHTILKKNVWIHNVPSGRKQKSCDITAFITSKQNLFGGITKCPSIKIIALLQSRHTILQKTIRFDASYNVPTCRK